MNIKIMNISQKRALNFIGRSRIFMIKKNKMFEENEAHPYALYPKMDEEIVSEICQSVGHASMCWEFPERAGVFDSDQAAKIAYDLCEYIATKMDTRTKHFGEI